jgi:hypothetical protein
MKPMRNTRFINLFALALVLAEVARTIADPAKLRRGGGLIAF